MRRRNPPLSEHMAHDDLREVLRLAAPRLASDPSEAVEVAHGVVQAALDGLDRIPREGEYVEAETIHDLLTDATDSLREALALMHPGRARWETRSNPSSMPPGFASFDPDDVFDAPAQPPGPPSPREQTGRLVQGLRRGDVVQVGRHKFDVFRGDGSVTVYVVKHGTQGRKYYVLSPRGHDAEDGTVEVHECDGMANPVGSPVAVGVPVRAGTVQMR